MSAGIPSCTRWIGCSGFHDPMASHLAMLYALAGEEMVRSAYSDAMRSGYLWHEFGDSNSKTLGKQVN